MEAFSGAAAAIALAVQLGSTVKTIKQFLRNVANAPSELLTIVDLLELLHHNLGHLEQLIRSQESLGVRLSSLALFGSALKNCEKRLDTAIKLVAELKASRVRDHRLQKIWGSLKIVSKKEDLQIVQTQLRDACMALQMAIATNAAEVQSVQHPCIEAQAVD